MRILYFDNFFFTFSMETFCINVEMNIAGGNSENLTKFEMLVWLRMTLVTISYWLSSFQTSWMPAITRYHQKKTKSQKPNSTKFGSIINFSIMSAILDGSHYQKSQKVAIIINRVSIETCNKNQTPLSLGWSST